MASNPYPWSELVAKLDPKAQPPRGDRHEPETSTLEGAFGSRDKVLVLSCADNANTVNILSVDAIPTVFLRQMRDALPGLRAKGITDLSVMLKPKGEGEAQYNGPDRYVKTGQELEELRILCAPGRIEQDGRFARERHFSLLLSEAHALGIRLHFMATPGLYDLQARQKLRPAEDAPEMVHQEWDRIRYDIDQSIRNEWAAALIQRQMHADPNSRFLHLGIPDQTRFTGEVGMATGLTAALNRLGIRATGVELRGGLWIDGLPDQAATLAQAKSGKEADMREDLDYFLGKYGFELGAAREGKELERFAQTGKGTGAPDVFLHIPPDAGSVAVTQTLDARDVVFTRRQVPVNLQPEPVLRVEDVTTVPVAVKPSAAALPGNTLAQVYNPANPILLIGDMRGENSMGRIESTGGNPAYMLEILRSLPGLAQKGVRHLVVDANDSNMASLVAAVQMGDFPKSGEKAVATFLEMRAQLDPHDRDHWEIEQELKTGLARRLIVEAQSCGMQVHFLDAPLDMGRRVGILFGEKADGSPELRLAEAEENHRHASVLVKMAQANPGEGVALWSLREIVEPTDRFGVPTSVLAGLRRQGADAQVVVLRGGRVVTREPDIERSVEKQRQYLETADLREIQEHIRNHKMKMTVEEWKQHSLLEVERQARQSAIKFSWESGVEADATRDGRNQTAFSVVGADPAVTHLHVPRPWPPLSGDEEDNDFFGFNVVSRPIVVQPKRGRLPEGAGQLNAIGGPVPNRTDREPRR